ncbi:MAG: glycoside hydrolase family 127 protein [Blautia sp.]|nr:glycoside hydrolase family 127 protein [Blautia sp.]
MNKYYLPLENVKIRDSFWSPIQNLVMDVVIPYQEKILNDEIPGVEKSHALANFRIAAGLEEGEFYGMVFQDSDVAKWLEGVAYALALRPDKALMERADQVIDVIEKAQQPDGYLNTFFTIKEPQHRWQNLLECHELYCAGHMMEAAAAYYEATGKDRLLHVMERMADHIIERFGPEEGKVKGVPGHEEVEIGLMRLYQVTGKEKYYLQAKYFIDQRGQEPNYFVEECRKRDWRHFGMGPENLSYLQAHLPVREQETAEGHSVRAVYLYTAMAAIARESHDQSLYDACLKLWDNITQKRMYITGGIGSTVDGEAFTIDYDLPNDSIYAETCASIGLVFFARQLLECRPTGKVADVMERALYNGILSGMQLDGKRFFYVNPLEVNLGVSGKLYGYRHVLPKRPGWYTCACCPPNVVRLITSLGKYAFTETEDAIYTHLYLGGTASFSRADISVESNYPWEGKIRFLVRGKEQKEFTLAVRVPGWAKNVHLTVNGEEGQVSVIRDGYYYLRRLWTEEDKVELSFDLPVRRIYANTAVRADAGCTAFQRGPIVYCFEGTDNGKELQALRIPADAEIRTEVCQEGILKGMVLLKIQGLRMEGSDELYSEAPPQAVEELLTAVPYFAWGNREEGQMRVWMRE